MNTIVWYDYETFGANPAWDRPAQFAAIRTDEDLNEIEEPVEIFCQDRSGWFPPTAGAGHRHPRGWEDGHPIGSCAAMRARPDCRRSSSPGARFGPARVRARRGDRRGRGGSSSMTRRCRMRGCRLQVILVVILGAMAAQPAVAGGIRGTVSCSDRCADFVVYVDGVAGDWSGAGEVVEFGQKDKIFIPHVLPLLEGSTLRIGNDDPFMHNVHARKDGETMFNLNILFQFQTVDQVITEPGIYRISCEPHPEMSAVLVVLDNPFFAQPDETGRFEIADVPPGGYALISLDAERERHRSKRLTVGDGVATVDF